MAFVNDNKETILAIIESWRGKFSDALLSQKLQKELGLNKPPSRFTLAKHDEIKLAINIKRQELRKKKSNAIECAKLHLDSSDKLSEILKDLSDDNATISELAKRVDQLENKNEELSVKNKRLEEQNSILLERFARWQHNLQKMDGVDLNKLAMTIDGGLPAKNR